MYIVKVNIVTLILFIIQAELSELCDIEEADTGSSDKPVNKESSLNVEEMIQLLTERIDMYKLAENNATKIGDTTKARRCKIIFTFLWGVVIITNILSDLTEELHL